MVDRPGFVKFYIPKIDGKRSIIPPMFIRSIQGTLPENVAFRDKYKNFWQVKVDKIGNKLYFTGGWKEFIHDNVVKSRNTIVFDYLSEGLFKFKIYGSSSCKEKGVGDHKYKNTIKLDDEVVDDTDNGHDVPTTHEENLPDDCPRGGQVGDSGTRISAHGSERKRNWNGEGIFKSGLVPRPVNPYFVTKKRPNREFELYIPVDVVKGFNLQLPETILLVDPTGRKFHAKLTIWKDGRVMYKGGGWKTLCEANLVGKDDSCICEFIEPQGEDLFLSVSFFRKN